MADLAGLEYFKVTGRARSIVADTSDPGVYPDALNVNCDVTLTPRLQGAADKVLRLQALDTLAFLAPIKARLSGGELRLVRPTENDSSEDSDPVGPGGVWMTAATAALELPDGVDLVIDVKFGQAVVGGQVLVIDPFTFAAPTTGGTVVSLARVPRLVDTAAQRGPVLVMIPDAARLDPDGRLVFSTGGVDLPGRLDLSPAIEQAVAAALADQ